MLLQSLDMIGQPANKIGKLAILYEGNGHKKYSVYVLRGDMPRLIHFGDSRYEQYRDRLGHWAHLDHGDFHLELFHEGHDKVCIL